jgi:hypothetical protein
MEGLTLKAMQNMFDALERGKEEQIYRCYINGKEMEMLYKHFGLEYSGQQEMNIRNIRFVVADLNMPIPIE